MFQDVSMFAQTPREVSRFLEMHRNGEVSSTKDEASRSTFFESWKLTVTQIFQSRAMTRSDASCLFLASSLACLAPKVP